MSHVFQYTKRVRAAGAILIVIATMATALAHAQRAAAAPNHTTQAPKCTSWFFGNAGQVHVWFPTYVMPAYQGAFEKVAYSADLYRWSGSEWVLWDGSKPFTWFTVDQWGRPLPQQKYPGYPTANWNPTAIYWQLTNGQPTTASGPYTSQHDLGVDRSGSVASESTNTFVWRDTPGGYYLVKHYLFWYATGETARSWCSYCKVEVYE